VSEATLSLLGKMGFGAPAKQSGPQVQVNVQQNGGGHVAPTVSAEVLEQAQDRLRASEKARLIEGAALHRPPQVTLEGPFALFEEPAKPVERAEVVEPPPSEDGPMGGG
jgi:hypothetical protein